MGTRIRGGGHVDPSRYVLKGLYGSKHQMNGIRVAKVVTTRLDRGVPVADVLDGAGNMYLHCRMMGIGGGGKDSFSYSVPSGGAWKGGRAGMEYGNAAEVLIAFPPGARPHPFILGTLFNNASRKHLTSRRTGSRRAPGGSGSTGGQNTCEPLTGGGPMAKKLAFSGSHSDKQIASHGRGGGFTHVFVNYDGFVRFNMHANPKDGGMKIALGAECCIRVSHAAAPPSSSHDSSQPYANNTHLVDSYPVDENVLLGNAFLAHYQTLVGEVDRLKTWVTSIASHLNTGKTAADAAKQAADSNAPGSGGVVFTTMWEQTLKSAPWTGENALSWSVGSASGSGTKASSWSGGDLAYKAETFRSAAFALSSKNICDDHKGA